MYLLHIFGYRYQYDWKLLEAKKNLLRTHTTAISAKMLANLGNQVSYKKNFKLGVFSMFKIIRKIFYSLIIKIVNFGIERLSSSKWRYVFKLKFIFILFCTDVIFLVF